MMEKYKDFVQSTGYGTGAGLCGWNCRHNIIPFDPQTMKNNLKQYGMEENKQMYEDHQKQRYFERTIRSYKRKENTAKKAMEEAKDEEVGDIAKEKYLKNRKLRLKWTKAYRNFSEKNNLRTQLERLKI